MAQDENPIVDLFRKTMAAIQTKEGCMLTVRGLTMMELTSLDEMIEGRKQVDTSEMCDRHKFEFELDMKMLVDLRNLKVKFEEYEKELEFFDLDRLMRD